MTRIEMLVQHIGRSLDEQETRHFKHNKHTRFGKLQVREENMKIVGAGIRQRRIIVFKECLDCAEVRVLKKAYDKAKKDTKGNKSKKLQLATK